jgi:hypothetical protein
MIKCLVTVKFLKNTEAYMKSSRSCGDGCCSYDEWTKEFFAAGEEAEAVAEKSNFLPNGTIVLEGLTFKEDYEIIVFP